MIVSTPYIFLNGTNDDSDNLSTLQIAGAVLSTIGLIIVKKYIYINHLFY
jgi:hypothetical protein